MKDIDNLLQSIDAITQQIPANFHDNDNIITVDDKNYNDNDDDDDDDDDSIQQTYTYRGVETLSLLSLSTLQSSTTSSNKYLKIILYQVNNQLPGTPFLQFMLYKYLQETDSILSFLTFEISKLKASISETCENVISKIFDAYFFACHQSDMDKVVYKGYMEENETMYIFFDFSVIQIQSHPITSSNDLWLVTVHEILNTKNILDKLKIDVYLIEFFLHHPKFWALVNEEKGVLQEIPCIGYVVIENTKKMAFHLTFGADSLLPSERLISMNTPPVNLSFMRCAVFKKTHIPLTGHLIDSLIH